MRIVNWLFYSEHVVVYAIGLAVCVWAYRKHRATGYLLLAAYFLFSLSTLTILPVITNVQRCAWFAHHQLSPATDKAYSEESLALYKKYYPAGFPPNFSRWVPELPIVLIVGLWLVARREPRKDAELTAVGNAALPRASA